MNTFIHTLVKSRYLTLGLGLLATSVPVFAQTATAPLTSTVTPVVATDPQAKALFDQTVERYHTLKTLSVVFEKGGNNQLIEFRAPQSLKITTTDSKGAVSVQQLFTNTEVITMQKPNDVFEWVSNPRPPVVAGQDARAKLASMNVGGLFFANFLAGVDPFRAGGRFQASSYTLGAPTTTDGVTLTPIVVTTVKPEKQPFDVTATFFLGQDHLVHRIETDVKSPDGKINKIVETFKSVQPDATLTDATFNFTPPAGATKVDKFSGPQVRAVVGQVPLPINTKDILGKDISFAQYKGKVLLVDFWATWCGPCKAELPNVKANYTKYHDKGFDVVGISLDQTTEPLAAFIKDQDMPWRQVFDGYWDGPIATGYNVRAIPATLLIGKDGKIAAIGARGPALEPAIQAALAVQ